MSSREIEKNAVDHGQVCGTGGEDEALNKEGNESDDATDNDGEMQLEIKNHSMKKENDCYDMKALGSSELSHDADTLCINSKISDDWINKTLQRKALCLICGPPKGTVKTEYTKLSSCPDVEKEIRELLKILSPSHESDACCSRCLSLMKTFMTLKKDFLKMKWKITALHIDAHVELPNKHDYKESEEGDHEMSDTENESCNTNSQEQNSEVHIKHEMIDIGFGEENGQNEVGESLKKHESNDKKTTYLKPKVYNCSYCERTFNRANTCAIHERAHNGEINFKCEYCEMSFTRKTDLREHGRVHELKCSYCGKSCWGPRALKRHELEIHIARSQQDAKAYKCSHCDKVLTRKNAFVVHEMIHTVKPCGGARTLRKRERKPTVLQQHTGTKIYQCSHCNESFRREIEFFLHEISHTADKVKCKHCEEIFSKKSELLEHDKIHELKCCHCGKSFWGTWALDKHERIHTGDKPYTTVKKIKCSYCDETFTKSEFVLHEKCHTVDGFKCLQCEKTFTKSDDLAKHEKSHEFKCSHCGRTCWGKKALDKHERFHTVEKPYKCNSCDKSFLYKSLLQDHKNTHTGEKPYLCQYCTKSFAKYSTLRSHEMTQHTGDRPHKCQYCGQGFAVKLACDEHERFHTGEKPFKCDHCDKSFVRKSNWRNHVKAHLGIKPQICSYCGKGFRDRGMLGRHERTHTGERPFKCKYCDKAFNRKSHCNTHEKRHTGEKPVKQWSSENDVKSLAKIHKSRHAEDSFNSENSDGLKMSQQLDSSFISQQFDSTYRPQHSESTFRPQHTNSALKIQHKEIPLRGPHSSNVFPTPEPVYHGDNLNPSGHNVYVPGV
ncbi:zinc finger protein 431 isoform X3 [Lingula anatina]|uniref:Zinc finger protein 431 isoform X3 n=1 Tax=Lingula anatina TaxID=7574 RepID=A0A1S3KAX3_LINAN|nr:zinc finger protein 431 isoform X3 [Lingula anatina]|eukprot:XP_013419798.1 zinc finger protein 431 isoform X3 [Lingula anatina]